MLQIKTADYDGMIAKINQTIPKPPAITKKMSHCKSDFIMNTQPLSSSYLGIKSDKIIVASSNLKG